MAKILNTCRNLVAKVALRRECHSRAIHPGRVTPPQISVMGIPCLGVGKSGTSRQGTLSRDTPEPASLPGWIARGRTSVKRNAAYRKFKATQLHCTKNFTTFTIVATRGDWNVYVEQWQIQGRYHCRPGPWQAIHQRKYYSQPILFRFI